MQMSLENSLLLNAVLYNLRQQYRNEYGNIESYRDDIRRRNSRVPLTQADLDSLQKQYHLHRLIESISRIVSVSWTTLSEAEFRRELSGNSKFFIPDIYGVYRFALNDDLLNYSTGTCLDIARSMSRFFLDLRSVGATPQQMEYIDRWIEMCNEAVELDSYITHDFGNR